MVQISNGCLNEVIIISLQEVIKKRFSPHQRPISEHHRPILLLITLETRFNGALLRTEPRFTKLLKSAKFVCVQIGSANFLSTFCHRFTNAFVGKTSENVASANLQLLSNVKG